MKNVIFTSILLLSAFGTAAAQSRVSNIRVQQLDAMVIVMYDLSEKADISVFVSFDGGANYQGPLQHVTGAVGKGVLPEKDKMLMWDVLREVGEADYSSVVIKIVADASQSSHTDAEAMQRSAGTLTYFGNMVIQGEHQLSLRSGKEYIQAGKEARQQYDKELRQITSGTHQSAKNLSSKEIRHVMAGTDALELYNKGQGSLNASRVWLLLGSIGLICGGLSFNDGNTALGTGCFVGSALSYTMFVLRYNKSVNLVAQSVDVYNEHHRKNAGVELKFGITGNGVGIAVRF